MSKQGSNSELFAHENDALTARPQLHVNFCSALFKTTLIISRRYFCARYLMILCDSFSNTGAKRKN